MTKRSSALLAVGSAITALFLYAAPAQAQATRTWVSGVGDDANPCSRTAPCKTFPGAISKTATNGEINCLDPAGFGVVAITKSITIDCRFTHGGILSASSTGVVINFDSNPGDVRKSVRLRGLVINGADTGTSGVRIIGSATSTGIEVSIEDSIIDGIYAGSNIKGIADERRGGGKLFVSNTTIRNIGGHGISVVSAAGAATLPLHIVIDNVRVQNTTHAGVFSWSSQVLIRRSTFSGNNGYGIYGEATAQVNVSDSITSHNQYGIYNDNNSATIRMSDTDVAFNETGINGTVFSYGNNRISGNTSPGTAPTAIAPALQ